MLQELKNLIATCDNCGYNQEYQSTRLCYPKDWGRARLLENLETRMEEETDVICPHCIISVQNGFKKYIKSTVRIF